jgi:hypothetical protein
MSAQRRPQLGEAELVAARAVHRLAVWAHALLTQADDICREYKLRPNLPVWRNVVTEAAAYERSTGRLARSYEGGQGEDPR